jgi:uncharacterized protein (TIGR02217 family)
LPGLKWDVINAPEFRTHAQRAVSGRELRAAFMQYPLWTFRLAYEVLLAGLAGTEKDTLLGFFLARQGSFDSFLYDNPADNTATAMPFGTGDGTITAFQLTRALGAGGFSFAEPVQNLNGAPGIYVAGTLKTVTTHYTISATGLVTFVTAPAAGQTLTWTGAFYYRCRFLNDMSEFKNFMKDLWSLDKLEFIGAPGDKV